MGGWGLPLSHPVWGVQDNSLFLLSFGVFRDVVLLPLLLGGGSTFPPSFGDLWRVSPLSTPSTPPLHRSGLSMGLFAAHHWGWCVGILLFPFASGGCLGLLAPACLFVPPGRCSSPTPPDLEGEPLLQELARRYVAAMSDMEGRKPGPTSILGEWGSKGPGGRRGLSGGLTVPVPPGTSQLRPGEPEGYRIPFNPSGTGCGAAMRSLAIGLRWGQEWGRGTQGNAWGQRGWRYQR